MPSFAQLSRAKPCDFEVPEAEECRDNSAAENDAASAPGHGIDPREVDTCDTQVIPQS